MQFSPPLKNIYMQSNKLGYEKAFLNEFQTIVKIVLYVTIMIEGKNYIALYLEKL